MDSGSSLNLKVSMFNSNDAMKAVAPAKYYSLAAA